MSLATRGSVGKCENLYVEEGPSEKLDTPKKGQVRMPKLPKTLTSEAKKYLLAVERGDLATVRRTLQKVIRDGSVELDINCLDPLGRGALLMAIEAEHLAMVELLVVMGVRTSDALLHAIDMEFVEAVELLLEHEELIHKEGELYSWESVDRDTATFTPEITPLILAAHRNNYEMVKILLDRGATLPLPHDIRCGCNECLDGARQDCLRHSASRINSYKALASPSLIALTSTDPLLTAFELSWELKQLSFSEPEFRDEYLELRKNSQDFAVALLSHTRTSHELQVMLNFDPSIMKEENDSEAELEPIDIHECGLARLRLAINYNQKKFVAHSWVQQLLASIWYDGLPGFRQKGGLGKGVEVVKVIVLAPFYCLIYMLAPSSQTGRLIRKPFMKFLIQTSSYLFFLLLLILVSQRVEEQFVEWLEAMKIRDDPSYHNIKRKRHRGNPPSILELLIVAYVVGFIWEETRELVREGFRVYVSNMWNAIDFLRNSTYVIVILLRIWAYIEQRQEIARDGTKAFIPREAWDDYDPQLIAEGLFAAANIFSALKLVHTSSINPHLGPLQISLGRMLVDILKFFFFYSLVLFAFACGLNQLLWYFADLEKDKCYSLADGMPDWKSNAEACMKWRRFGNLFESSQSLFWASFGMVGLADFELTGIKSYTRFWGLLMFGSYSVINVIVLLNLLIAMMSNSYAMITDKADTEWKFARTKLWLSYFDEDSTLPPPFNLIPTPKQLKRLLGRIVPGGGRSGKSVSKQKETRLLELRDQAREYIAVMRALVWRYISGMHRKLEERPVTEDDVNEIKGEISTLRCDLAEMFRNNGMNVACLAQKQATVSKKTRDWARRLFRGFHVAPAAGDDTILLNVGAGLGENGEDERVFRGSETGSDKFRRMARLALLNRERLARPRKHLSHIGRSTSSESFKSRDNLLKAMEAAKKMVETSSKSSPIPPSPEESLEDNDKRVATQDRSSVIRKGQQDSVLPVVEESIRSVSPYEDDQTSSKKDDAEVNLVKADVPTFSSPPPGPGAVSLMDEPLPDNIILMQPTTPQSTSVKYSSDADPPAENDGNNELARTKSLSAEEDIKSSSELSTLPPQSETRISIENETSGLPTPSSQSSCKSDSLERPTNDAQVGQVAEDNTVPSLKILGEEHGSTAGGDTTSSSSNFQPMATDPDQPSSSINVSSLAATSLPTSGQKIDDVKTIKRTKPGGSWF